MCVIFLFIILIYNHFFKLKEGLENCDLTGFKKKPPAEVNQMSSTNKAKYNCQLKVFNQKIYSKEEMKKTIEETSNKIQKHKSIRKNSIQTYLDRFKNYWPKYLDEKKKRKVAVTKIVGYVCPTDISYVKKYCDELITIPMNGKINSLNISATVSAVVFERNRQLLINK